MRKYFLLIALGMILSSAILIFSGCTKEGPQGANGKDMNATCTQCHNFSDSIVVKIFQYDASRHALGDLTVEGTRNACAPCHTSQGFDEVIVTNADTTKTGVYDAAPINCRTCHNIHTTYTSADWGLKITSAFHPRYDKTATVDLAVNGGSSNLCGRCHQVLKTSPFPDKPTNDADSMSVFSPYWGPHHGPQSLMLAGMGAFEIGAAKFDDSPHKDKLACGSCHQAPGIGNFVGGHTLNMSSDETGDNVAPCKACHNSATDFDVDGKQTEIEGMFDQLKLQQAQANILDTNSMQIKAGKKYSQKQLAVLWNFLMVYNDRSMGVHNYKYTHDMLQAGIDYYTTKGY